MNDVLLRKKENTPRATKNTTRRIVPVEDGNGDILKLPTKEHLNQRGKRDVFILGMTCVLAGQSSGWNTGLSAGLYSYVIMYLMMGFAYICFCLCLAEVTGALPFAGGAYGIARCTLGFFPAFLIGIAETMEYVASAAFSAIAITDLTIQAFPHVVGYEPLIWAIIYGISTGVQIVGGRAFWIVSFIVGLSSLVVSLTYIYGSLGIVNFTANALSDPSQFYVGGASLFMYNLPYTAWSFLGVEILDMK